MGIFSAISNWNDERYEKSKIESLYYCPDCNGEGVIPIYPAPSGIHIPPYDCPGCSGSGLYSDWFEANK